MVGVGGGEMSENISPRWENGPQREYLHGMEFWLDFNQIKYIECIDKVCSMFD